MCMPKKQTIQKADPVAPPPPPVDDTPKAPVLNEQTRASNSDGRKAGISRQGRKSVTIPLISSSGSGINIPS